MYDPKLTTGYSGNIAKQLTIDCEIWAENIYILRLELRERIGSPISEQEGQNINPTQGHTYILNGLHT